MRACHTEPRQARADMLQNEGPFQQRAKPARVDVAAIGQAVTVAQPLPIALYRVERGMLPPGPG